jgi:hypothetical protein
MPFIAIKYWLVMHNLLGVLPWAPGNCAAMEVENLRNKVPLETPRKSTLGFMLLIILCVELRRIWIITIFRIRCGFEFANVFFELAFMAVFIAMGM